jgi:flagellar biosynthesis component FlhA
MQREFQKSKEQLIDYVREDLKRNPQKKLQTFQQGNQIIIKELSIEEVLEQDRVLKQKLNQMEKQYKEKFNQTKEKLANIINNQE